MAILQDHGIPDPAILRIRRARLTERDALGDLIGASARELSRGNYTPEQVEAALHGTFGVDSQLIADGSYWVAIHHGELAACGGWSDRRTLFGSDAHHARDATRLVPGRDCAKIRAFFVHPRHARRGIGRQLLWHCEAEARRAGFRDAELMSTLPGIPFYRALGYRAGTVIRHRLTDTVHIDLVPMHRSLGADWWDSTLSEHDPR
jgi:GNAT superfamily N-acetyltransferase